MVSSRKETRQHVSIRVGISSCLLGESVRYDGAHRLDRCVLRHLGRHFEWVSICPEVEAGLGVPRETLSLIGDPTSPRLVFGTSGRDVTLMMTSWARERLGRLESEDLCGYVLKSGSPSCGMQRVSVHRSPTDPHEGVGLFAGKLMRRFPRLPVEEAERLHDPSARHDFIERVYSYRRLEAPSASEPSRGSSRHV
jgi:uncharacterized protein YbbK (DUF523 family)